ncbi:hypothetical protein FRC06_004938 [Ceratobasidium sp. 370]|nr:hypothetical protein FRC06_004938 [Ceratobasidium sp. 370]
MANDEAKVGLVNEGYYRWKVITNLADRSALKAFLHTDSLVNEDCPWHPGKKGVELYMGKSTAFSLAPFHPLPTGTIHSGESRLCFSFKQVAYISYWLHTMGLTSTPLPLPSAYYLLTPSDLRGPPSPVTYKTVSELRNALKDVGKHNKRVKTFAGDVALGELRTVFERVRTVWGERRGVWIAIDFEGWERDHKMITEFGWALVRWEEVEGEVKEGEERFREVREEGHWTVKEYAAYRNGTFVLDNRDRYDFGETEVMPRDTFKNRIGEMITKYAAQGPLYLIFHDRYGDVKYLQQLQVPGISDIASIPGKPPGPGIYCPKQKDMFAALEGDSSQQRGLERVCGLLKIRGFNHPHNAGNDAHFTMEALRAMASGQPLDLQREARWPNQTEVLFGQQRSVKVEWTEQDDSDWDDY